MFSRLSCWSVLLVSLFALSACGGGGGGGTTPPSVTTYTISGTVSGLAGSGLVLQNNGGDDLSISADGTFSFASQMTDGANYSVSVLTQPTTPAQVCTVSNGSGTLAASNISNISVTCVTTYTINVTVSGLTGSGLLLQNNGGDDLSISADGGFSFTTQIADSSGYSVTVLSQPISPWQNCVVTNGSGTVAGADVTDVSIACTTNTYTISVTASGLKGTGLVLRNNGADDLSISADGSFSFTTQVASGATYAVSILTQPSTPAQNCVVSYGSGTVSGSDVTDVEVLCSNYWIWISGSDLGYTVGVYGTKGVADAANIPGARKEAVSWCDSAGTLWLFGGDGYDGVGGLGSFNDLWKFDGSNWTWVSGSNVVNQSGVYGTQGLAVATNVPGARVGATTWIDSGGVLWLFGGYGMGKSSIGGAGRLNDLWKFDGTNWIWVSGSNTVNPSAVYGAKGVANASNVPGGRAYPYSWIDSSNTLWLFGGYGHDGAGAQGRLNDLWKFDGTNWTWVSGSNTGNQIGVYGTQGIADVTNIPGGRNSGSSWIDSSNTLWLFGGYSYDSAGTQGEINDLWKFDGSNWIWVSGSDLISQVGVYGTRGVAASSNVPGARYGSISWVDSSDTLWLFGGRGYTFFNDLWKFDGVDWTWVSGSDLTNRAGIYGDQGIPSAATIPGARYYSTSWVDSNNNLWVFGGRISVTNENFNDLWRYTP